MTESSGRGEPGRSKPGDSWEQRASDMATDIQRWLIRSSAKNMRDELGDQVRKAFRGEDNGRPGDVWETATTEPPRAADEAPECAWCPVCRAARRLAEARAASANGGAGSSALADAADVMASAVRDALSGIDSILSYRPGESGPPDHAGHAETPAESPAQTPAESPAQSPAESSSDPVDD